MRTAWTRLAALALMGAALVAPSAGCKKGEEATPEKRGGPGKGGGAPSFPVEVMTVPADKVEYVVPAVGSVEAFEQVQLTARVAGVVEAVRFKEGERAKKGQVLVEIDPARYNLAVRAARAVLDRIDAGKSEAEAGLGRREAPGSESVFSKEDVATWRSRVATSAAQQAEAKATLDQALLNLRDAYVRAPIEGKIQTRNVQTGQYVQVGTVLAMLLRRDPLLLRFQIPDVDAMRVKPGMTARFSVRGDPRPFTARITHVADLADPVTRMGAVTGEVEVEGKYELRPGAFAEVPVPIGESADAPVIPSSAVRPSERGFLAYVIEGSAAKERVLTLGLRTADGRVEVRSGVKVGEQLVVRGAEPLKDGAQVRIAPAAPAGTAAPVTVPAGTAAPAAPGAQP